VPTFQSLDELIANKAEEFADQIKAAAAMADKEEEIRIEAEKQLAFIQKEAGIKLEGKHEFTVASGRVDSVYDRVIIEYKNPSSPAARIGPKADSPGTKKVVEQIRKRFYDLRQEHGQPLNSLFGVGLDGNYFVFVRYRDDKWQIQDPVEVNKHSAERFLWALFNLGAKGKPFSPEYLAGDFGGQAPLAQQGVRILYDAISSTDNPKAQTFFNQWRILFGEVCGYDVDNPSDKLKKLAESYGIHTSGLKAAELLFSVHSYYALFMKLMASEIVAFFHKLPTPLQRLMQAPTTLKLKREMEDLESGSIFRHLNITNFLEGDLFSWYLPIWSDPIEKLVRDMVARLDAYNPGTLSEDVAGSRDLLKKLYQELFPKSVRHDLGEYYTPDWLAEYTLDEVGFNGDPDKRLLDPSCGSGTFLVSAINRIRTWYEANREHCQYDEGELCRKILANVVGFDLNPLAVMAARTNYLIAIRDLIGRVDRIEIPVYLCDSIVTPSEYGDLFTGNNGTAKELKTAAARFLIPTEIAHNAEDVGKYAEQLERCIKNGYSAEEFVQRCNEENLPVRSEQLHKDLYSQLVALDKANKNGVWARIIKNAFAPLFTGRFDFVVGNPPWINWESLPKEYRDSTLTLWDRYNLRFRGTSTVRLGNVKKELSALFVYVASDHYLVPSGRLGFVITQTVFKSGANQGFRRFSLPDTTKLGVSSVSDMSLFLPFEGAINRTAVVILRKGKTTNYPVPYKLWLPDQPRTIVEANDLATVRKRMQILAWLATPVEPSHPESPWLTAPKNVLSDLQKVVGDQRDAIIQRSYAGSCTWLNGVYWADEISSSAKGVIIRNRGDCGRKKVRTIESSIESSVLFPLLRGRDLKAWCAEPSGLIIVPHRPDDFAAPISVGDMKQKYPRAYDYFLQFEKDLKKRSGYKQLHKSRKEFYVMGNVGNYTLEPYKVAFKDLTEFFQCAVVRPHLIDGKREAPVVPDHTVLFLNGRNPDEAYFFAGVLNSIPSRVALYCQSVGVQTQRYFTVDIARVRALQFSAHDAVHKRIADLSKKCHDLACSGKHPETLLSMELELAERCAELWGIGKNALKAILDAYQLIDSFRTAEVAEAEDDDE
jgi:hypothetical protein